MYSTNQQFRAVQDHLRSNEVLKFNCFFCIISYKNKTCVTYSSFVQFKIISP